MIIGLESPPVLIGVDIMRPLRVHIDVTHGTATPAKPHPQTIHLNAAQTQNPPASRALLLQAVDLPAETVHLVCCHNPWPSEDVYFYPEEGLPTFVSGVPALTSGSEVWVAIHNHRPEPLALHTGQTVGTLEIVTLADSPPPPPAASQIRQLPVPEHLSPAKQQQLKALFHEFSDIISQGEDDLGCTPLLQHTIETEGLPLRQPYCRQNPAVSREEMAQVQQMLSSGVIRLSNSPWASPVVMVKKKDGSLRFCVDSRQLNVATIKDAHPILRIDDLLDALHGAHWFTTLDLKSGYWQVPIQEQDKEKTAFRTSSGQLFEFNQVPFGLCNAPATFSRPMDRVLAGFHWETCLFYLDDIIVFAATWEEHLARLRQVFERPRHAQLKFGAEKCTFAAKEVSYLGHRFTSECFLPDFTLLAAIREIAPPRMQQKFAHSWASPGTTGVMSKILPQLPPHSTLSPGKKQFSIGVQSARTPSTASRPSSPPAPSRPSRTSACRSGCIPTPPPQASAQSSHKYGKARSTLFALPRAPSTRRRKPTLPRNWSASPSSGPSPNSAPT